MDTSELLEKLRWEKLGNCTRCPLHKTRKNLVFGTGDPEANIMFVGEGPGRMEDERGQPFAGGPGKVLSNMIRHAGLRKDQVYVTNVVKCRPPRNRDPNAQEVSKCSPFLAAQIHTVKPRVLVALGRFAANTLSRQKSPLTMHVLREHMWEFENDHGTIPVIPTYHPAYILRHLKTKTASEKAAARELYRSVISDVRRAVAMSQPLNF